MSHICHFTNVDKGYWKMYVKYIIKNSNYGSEKDNYSTDHASFKKELCNKYPSKESLIKKCFKDYGF